MDIEEIKETDIWQLFEKSRNYCRTLNMFSDVDKFHRFYNGDQWEGLIIKGVQPVQENFIKTIVKFKVSNINANLWAANFSSQNFENEEFRETAENTCEMLNKKVAKVWEKDSMDSKIRRFSNDAAITSEGVAYVNYDRENQLPKTERIAKTDIFYGNENDEEIQEQPYILIKKRLPVSNAQEQAKANGLSEEKLQYIVGDKDTFDNSGDSSKQEKDDMCTVITKMYKKNGKVYFSQATKYVELRTDKNSGLSLYPVAHFPWEHKEGSARGQGEVEFLIPNQIEVNKTIMRRLVTVKHTAYPTKAVNIDLIENPEEIEKVGGLIKVSGGVGTNDVSNAFANIQPAQMSPDVEKVQNELITVTRELNGASEFATGGVDPTKTSGRAILAVQQAQQQPLVEQLSGLKKFLEDLVRIYLDMFITYSKDGLKLENAVSADDGTEKIEIVNVPQTVLNQLEATVKIDITPKGAFDKFAQEESIENLLTNGYFNIQRLSELKILCEVLPDDAVMPKMQLEKVVKLMEEEQRKIAMIDNAAQLMKQNADQFLNSDADVQADQINNAIKNQGGM